MITDQPYAISVKGLTKEFKLYDHPSQMFRELISGKPQHRSFYALRDVTFNVKRGQVVGIMGRNGAGKSTLLKIISGTLDKTAGDVSVNGRISSILELGTAFNPEYTGRENIYLGGLMIGLSREEIKEKENWIIDFSELREFIDQPFKTYSSGMQARLTFATAICVDPDILVVDEALSVGDAKFQRKSFGKFQEFREAGNTILLVSHNPNTINEICDSAILMDRGQIIDYGTPGAITKHYWEMMFIDKENIPVSVDGANEIQNSASLDPTRQNHNTVVDYSGVVRAGDRIEAEIIEIGILDSNGKKVRVLESGGKYSFFVRALFHKDLDEIGVGFHIGNEKGVTMYGISMGREQGVMFPPQKKGNILEAKMNVSMWLTNGEYLLSAGIGDGKNVIDYLYDALTFTIPRLPWIQHASVVNLEPNFEFNVFDNSNQE